MIKTLRNMMIGGLTAAYSAVAGPLDINGVARVALEDGTDSLPNLIVNTQLSESLKLSAAYDVYDPDKDGPSDYKGRLFWLNASTQTPVGTMQAGMLSPFFNTQYRQALEKNRPLIAADNGMTLNDGITGVKWQKSWNVYNALTLDMQAYAGTKIAALNEDFGAETGPGYKALVAGGGLGFTYDVSDETKLRGGWRETHFGEGDAGVSRGQTYYYTTLTSKIGSTDLKIHGETTMDGFKSDSGTRHQGRHTIFLQTVTPISEDFSIRCAAGHNDDGANAETAILYHKGPWSAQAGVSQNFDTNDTSVGISLSRSF